MFVNARAVLWREGVDGIEYLVQTRDRPGQPQCLEFPGGTVEAHESLIEALKREVREETGLEVVEIEGQAVRHEGGASTVECVEPFAAYQTTEGLNGMGVYFRCRAEGELLEKGDGELLVVFSRKPDDPVVVLYIDVDGPEPGGRLRQRRPGLSPGPRRNRANSDRRSRRPCPDSAKPAPRKLDYLPPASGGPMRRLPRSDPFCLWSRVAWAGLKVT